MKKKYLLVALLLGAFTAQAQISFTEITGTPFTGVIHSSVAFADIDGDNDQDVLITGEDAAGMPVSTLFTNGGTGNYTLVTGTPFTPVKNSAIAFADIDGDNDQDVLVTGMSASNGQVTKLYSNNGSGTFTEVSGTPFDGVDNGAIAFADVDNDNDLDVLITGSTLSNSRIANLYTNDGSGTFSLVSGTPFTGVSMSAVAFADIDNDNDLDVLIIGKDASSTSISKLYTNDGSGNFMVVTGSSISGVSEGEVAFTDFDGDGDQDLVVSGENASTGSDTYINDGNGGFTASTNNNNLDYMHNFAVDVADIDGDGDIDMILTGPDWLDEPRTKVFLNNGTGAFNSTLLNDDLGYGSIVFADIDNDGDQDYLVTGKPYSGAPNIALHRNETPQLENVCAGADTINNLFGGALNTPVVSSLYNNTNHTSAPSDPSTGISCFEENGGPSLENTIWYTFTGDGNAYRIRTVQCNATNYINGGDTQVAIYEGDCSTLTPVVCNEDEDVNNNIYNIQVDLETTAGTEYRMLIDGYDGSVGEFCLEVTRIGVTGIEDETALNNIDLYPNPTTDNINWNYVGAQTARVYDFTGRLVLTQTNPNGRLNIAELPAGIYSLVLATEEGVYSSQVVKQ